MNEKPKPKPKPTPEKPVDTTTEEVFDAVVEVEQPTVEVEAEVAPEPVAKKSVSSAPLSPAGQTINAGEPDVVYFSKIAFENVYKRKSLSVHHVQRRLTEWGFIDAYNDLTGFYSQYTRESMKAFQAEVGLPVTEMPDMETLTKLFENDSNVTLAE